MTENSDELCDEEKSFNDWFKNNHSLIYGVFGNTLEAYKKVYMIGYAAGFHSKLKYSSEEQLQK
jgi:hypothetical protein